MSTNTNPKHNTIAEILEMNQTEKDGPPSDADGAKSWHDWFRSEEWQTTIQACRFAVALGASSNATIYPSKVAELARDFARSEPVTHKNKSPNPYVGESSQPESDKATIFYHGGQMYSASNNSTIRPVSDEMHHMLEKFLDKNTRLRSKEFNLENVPCTAKRIEEMFPQTVEFSGHSKKGYRIKVQKSVLIDG